jgi:hypothetical protein
MPTETEVLGEIISQLEKAKRELGAAMGHIEHARKRTIERLREIEEVKVSEWGRDP